MRVVITGVSGLIGRVTMRLLEENGIPCIGISRNATDPLYNESDYSIENLAEIFSGCDVVVHLAAKRSGGGMSNIKNIRKMSN